MAWKRQSRLESLSKVWIIFGFFNFKFIFGFFNFKLIFGFLDFLREDSFRNCLDIWFAYCSFEYVQNREAGQKFFANTIQLMLSSAASKSSLDLLRFTLGFVRLELDLDRILTHFLYHLPASGAIDCPVCVRKRNCCQETDEKILEADEAVRQISMRFLVAVIIGNEGLLDLVDSSRKVSSVEMVRVVRIIEERIENIGQDCLERTELIQTRVMLAYLIKGMCYLVILETSFNLFFLSHLDITKATDLIDSEQLQLQTSKSSTTPILSIQRSHHLLHLQLTLHAYHLQSYPRSRTTNQSTRSLLTQAQSVIKQALQNEPTDPLFLSAMVALEVGFNNLWFRLRRQFGSPSATSSEFESYLIRKYLNGIEMDSEQRHESQESNWNRCMASLHGELLILDRIAQAQGM